MAANNILSDQRLLAFHYLAALFNLLRGAELRCDQRLLAFHYLAGQWLKHLASLIPQLILQAFPTIEPPISKNSLNSEKLLNRRWLKIFL